MNKIRYKVLTIVMVPTVTFASSYNYSGNINYNVRNSSGEDKAAVATKYDPKDTAFGSFQLLAGSEQREFSLTGRDLASDSQGFVFSGRHFNVAKYSVFLSDLTHQISNGASVGFTTGVGTSELGYSGATSAGFSTNASTWNKFDFKVERKNYGLNGVMNIGDHFYLAIDTNRIEYEGVRPGGFYSLAGKTTEYPEFFKTGTNIASLDFGYKNEKSSVSLKGYLSKETPDVDRMLIKDPFLNNIYQEITIAPESNFYKIALEGSIFDLPFNSVFSFDLNTTKSWNELYLNRSVTGGSAGATKRTLTFSNPTFEGDLISYNAKVNFKSRWTDKFSSLLFLRYFDRNNDSTVITTTADSTPTNYRVDAQTNKPFEFSRKNAGLVLDYQLPVATKITGSLDYLDTTRGGRLDVDKTKDYKATVDFANYFFDSVTPKMRYTYLQRESDFLAPSRNEQRSATTGAISTAATTYKYVRRMDVNDKTMHEGDLGADVNLIQSIKYGIADLSLLSGYRRNDYKHVVMGRVNDTRLVFDTSFVYNLRDVVKVSIFGLLEKTTEDSAVGKTDAIAPNTYSAVNITDKVTTYGVDIFIPVLEEKLDVKLGYSKYKSDGGVDYINLVTYAANKISENDDYEAETISAEIDYYWSKSLALATGYRHEQFNYGDVRVNGYTQNVSSGSYLYSGAYRDRSYNVNEGWLGATYKF